MGDGNEGKKSLSKMEKLSLETNRYPRDLLQRFMASNQGQSQLALTSMSNEEEEEEEIELNLGLSLGGRFGVDRRSPNKKKLMRSSSIAGSIPIVRDDDAVAPPLVSCPTLIRRTSSLPTETEEQRRKRKELQTLRRMEAKRRRSEKQRNLKGEKDGSGGGGGSESERSLEDERREIEANLRGRIEREQYMAAARRLGSFGLPTWGAAARQAILAAGGKKGNYYMEGSSSSISSSSSGGGGGVQVQGFVQPIESQGGTSSGMSESESRPVQGSSSCSEAIPGSIQPLQERSNQEAAGSSGAQGRENACNSSAEMESPSKRPEVVENRGREMGSNSMEDMPCVFTQGDGPNGRRIEGILYKYGKGEEVRIMCVCHGSFLSPAEFVKHAGGSDVAHPLKHIVVNPASSSFL